jgi:hypothetical protein
LGQQQPQMSGLTDARRAPHSAEKHIATRIDGTLGWFAV